MEAEYFAGLRDFYRKELLENILPFWMKYARDFECGGYITCLNRNGSAYDYDKVCMWHAGRMIWTYSFMYNEMAQNPEWLEMARHGVEFLMKHGFSPDGRMYYALTRDGRPLQPPMDITAERSAITGLSEFARATGDEALYEKTRGMLMRVWEMINTPGSSFEPFIADTRPVRIHAHSMITLNVIQEVRRFREDPLYESMIEDCIGKMVDMHIKADRRLLLEIVGWEGEPVPGSKGRWVNPGHMIEGGTFLIHEGMRRKESGLTGIGADLIGWGFDLGWDKEFGGIFNDVDSEGLPVPDDALRYDSKLWWQHAEALYGLLLAFDVTGEEKFLQHYRQTHDYSFEKFADPEYGEWFAFLDRRGNKVGTAKGSARKCAFHIPRNFYLCYRLLGKISGEGSSD